LVNPVIGIAKQASAVTDNGNGSYTTTITLNMENLGSVDLSNVQVTDDLASVFTSPVAFSVGNVQVASGGVTVNSSYNGDTDTHLLAGTDTLVAGATATVTFDITFTPNGKAGPFTNSATAEGEGPGNVQVFDISDDGANPDPDGDGNPNETGENNPTPIDYPRPVIGIAKQAAPVTDNGNGSFTTTIALKVENLGNVPLSNVQVTDDLASVFTSPVAFSVGNVQVASGGVTVNSSYNGDTDTHLLAGTDILVAGATATVTFDITFTPNGKAGPFNNSATAEGEGPGNVQVSDISDDGANPDPDGDGNPDETGENDPTPIDYPRPVIGVAKQASAVTDNGNGSYTTTISLSLENLGNVSLSNVQVTDSLSGVFTNPATFTVGAVQTTGGLTANNNYDGDNDANLLAGSDSLAVGATATVAFDINFTPNGASGPFNNSAAATGQSPGGSGTTDISDDGTDPDPDGNGNPGDQGENDPTPIDYQSLIPTVPVPTLGGVALLVLALMLLGVGVITSRRHLTR